MFHTSGVYSLNADSRELVAQRHQEAEKFEGISHVLMRMTFLNFLPFLEWLQSNLLIVDVRELSGTDQSWSPSLSREQWRALPRLHILIGICFRGFLENTVNLSQPQSCLSPCTMQLFTPTSTTCPIMGARSLYIFNNQK